MVGHSRFGWGFGLPYTFYNRKYDRLALYDIICLTKVFRPRNHVGKNSRPLTKRLYDSLACGNRIPFIMRRIG